MTDDIIRNTRETKTVVLVLLDISMIFVFYPPPALGQVEVVWSTSPRKAKPFSMLLYGLLVPSVLDQA